jgi:hypothetical protein
MGHISYMNDAMEFDLSLNLIKDHLFAEFQRKAQPLPTGLITTETDRLSLLWGVANNIIGTTMFVTCFCENGDLLSQWRGYAGGDYGYSLGFKITSLKSLAHNSGFILGKCIYDPTLQEEIIKQIIDHLLNNPDTKPTIYNFGGALQYGAFFKDPSFSAEQEWRLVSVIPDVVPTPTRFRKGKSEVDPDCETAGAAS